VVDWPAFGVTVTAVPGPKLLQRAVSSFGMYSYRTAMNKIVD
jgi:hypothetical protein